MKLSFDLSVTKGVPESNDILGPLFWPKVVGILLDAGELMGWVGADITDVTGVGNFVY